MDPEDQSDSSIQNNTSKFTNCFKDFKHLGGGGFGTVYKARHTLDKKEYAIKIVELNPDDEEENELMYREAWCLADLDHQNVVRYHGSWFETLKDVQDTIPNYVQESHSDEYGSEQSSVVRETSAPRSPVSCQGAEGAQARGVGGGSPPASKARLCLLIQMELCENNLRQFWQDKGKDLVPEEKVRLISEIVQGLIYIHDKGVCHRDLNPNNIFLAAGRKIKIGDFGLSRRLLPGDGALSRGIGTQLYQAPEINEEHYNCSVDLYSLGIIIFEMSYPMATDAERNIVLSTLQKEPGVPLPKDFKEKAENWQQAIVPSLLNHEASARLPLHDILQSLPGSNAFKNATDILPNTEEYGGVRSFEVEVTPPNNQKKFLFSDTRKKIFVQPNYDMTFKVKGDFKVKRGGTPLYVRGILLFSNPGCLKDPVTRCHFHRVTESHAYNKTSNNKSYTHLVHVLTSECESADHQFDVVSKRHSVKVRIEDENEMQHATITFKLKCLSTCQGGIDRKDTDLVLTLENESSEVLGRRKFPIKICTQPSDAMNREKAKQESVSSKPFKKPIEEKLDIILTKLDGISQNVSKILERCVLE